MHSAVGPLPRWKTDNIYSGLDGADYRAAFDQLVADTTALESLLDQHDVRRLTKDEARQQQASIEQVVPVVLPRLNALGRLAGTLDSFVYAFLSTNSYDVVANRETSKLELLSARRQKLDIRWQGYLGSIAEVLPGIVERTSALAVHRYYLLRTAKLSQFLMSDELEGLAADLCLDSAVAFGKLQGSVTSQLKVPFERDGKTEETPITVVRTMCFSPDRTVRERAYHAEQAGWRSIRTTVAACLNSVKGTAGTLAKRRGRGSVLETALNDNHIDQRTLEAMLGSICEAMPMFRRYLQVKAGKLGLKRLAWWDIFAPLGGSDHKFTWPQARDLIVTRFGRFSPELAAYAARSFDEGWIDAEPRDGKRGGAFCMEVIGVEESRILANFDGSFEEVSTLAHELGHGYHNECQKGLPALLRGAPMALAETASIFCETLLAEASLEDASPATRLGILEAQLCGATQVCLDITSRFIFESSVLAQRSQSELSPDEFCALMRQAQTETYGEAIEPETYHPYMWLWKPHYYSYTSNFYNFPYAFGHLFALGLYAIYVREQAAFVPRYVQLLRSTNMADAAPLAAQFGIDITQPAFWQGSLAIIAGQLERYEAL